MYYTTWIANTVGANIGIANTVAINIWIANTVATNIWNTVAKTSV